MAVGAGDGGMFTCQREDGLMRETFQAVHPVMTGHAVRAVLGQVFLHEGLIMVCVAGDAGCGGCLGGIAIMAGGAVNWVSTVIHAVQV